MRFLSRFRRASAAPVRARPRRLGRKLFYAGCVVAVAIATAGTVRLMRSDLAAQAADTIGRHFAVGADKIGFSVASVTVEGRERVSRAAILEALDVRRGTPIFAVDLGAAKERLEALAWVRSADVERQLPDTIVVHLVERRPLAYWQRDGHLALIDRDGKVIQTEHLETFGPFIVLVGDDAPKLGAGLIDMLAREPTLASHVVAAVRVGGRRWNLRLDSGIDIALPEQDPEAAWHRLAMLDRDQNLLARNIEAVDLRLPDRLVVRVPPEPKPVAKKPRAAGKPT